MWSFSSVLATCSERMKESLCKNSVSTIEVVIKILRSYIAVYAGFTAKLEMRKISELSGNLKMDSFFLKNQEIIREFWLDIGEIREQYFLVVNVWLALFSVMVIFMIWNIFLLFIVMSINVPACIYVFKDVCEHSLVTCLTVLWCTITAWISVLLKWLIYTGIKKERFSGK